MTGSTEEYQSFTEPSSVSYIDDLFHNAIRIDVLYLTPCGIHRIVATKCIILPTQFHTTLRTIKQITCCNVLYGGKIYRLCLFLYNKRFDRHE